MRTIAYIDGFNVYYGCLKRSSYKWLDIKKVVQRYARRNQIISIKYFTAPVAAREQDPEQPLRQQMLFRALRTIPEVEIIEGHFLSKPVRMAELDDGGVITGRTVRVLKTEEKGSDVNLAAHLLVDAFRDYYDVAFVFSNDSDLLTPIRMVREEFGKKVAYVNPHSRPSNVLKQQCDYYYQMHSRDLKYCLFPDVMEDAKGVFRKPSSW